MRGYAPQLTAPAHNPRVRNLFFRFVRLRRRPTCVPASASIHGDWGPNLGNTAAQVKPGYCHYAKGACDQSFDGALHSERFFVYPSKPRPIADALQNASDHHLGANSGWKSWKDLVSSCINQHNIV